MLELASLHDDQVFLRREALDCGYGDRDLRAALGGGVIARVRHGAYVPADVWASADATQKHLLRTYAVVRSHSSRLVLSHTSAAVAHSLRVHGSDLSRVHVTCLDAKLARTTSDVVYHQLPHHTLEIQERDGLMIVEPVRAALEAATLTDVAGGLVLLDSLLDLTDITVDEIWRTYARMKGFPHARRLQVTVRLARRGSQSVGETLMRHLFWREHLPEPVLQFEVRDERGNLIGRTDFAWPDLRLLGEFDGSGKYKDQDLLQPGETSTDAVLREKRREDRLREATGCLMIRLVWADLHRPQQTAARIREQMRRGSRLVRA